MFNDNIWSNYPFTKYLQYNPIYCLSYESKIENGQNKLKT